MGVYDIFSANKKSDIDVQLKCGTCCMRNYYVGDKVHADEFEDGIYVGHMAAVVIKDGIVVMVTNKIFDKWGGILIPEEIISPNSEISNVLKNE